MILTPTAASSPKPDGSQRPSHLTPKAPLSQKPKEMDLILPTYLMWENKKVAPRASPLPRRSWGWGAGQSRTGHPPPQSAGRPWGSQGLQAIQATAGRCSQGEDKPHKGRVYWSCLSFISACIVVLGLVMKIKPIYLTLKDKAPEPRLLPGGHPRIQSDQQPTTMAQLALQLQSLRFVLQKPSV